MTNHLPLTKRVELTLEVLRRDHRQVPAWTGDPSQPLSELQPIPDELLTNLASLTLDSGCWTVDSLTPEQRLDIVLGILASLGLQGFTPRKLAHVAGVPERTINRPLSSALNQALIHHHAELLPLIERVRRKRKEQTLEPN